MNRYLKIRHRGDDDYLIIQDWFRDNDYEFAPTGASNNPDVDISIARTMFVTVFTERAELATRLAWNVED